METSGELKQEINRRRRADGYVEDVPPHVWESPAVRPVLDVATAYAQGSGTSLAEADFTGDDALDALLEAVHRAINAQTSYAFGLMREQADRRDADSAAYNWRRDRAPNTQLVSVELPVGEREREAGVAAAEFLSWQMSQDVLVQEFQRDVLGTARLSEEEAWEFLTSPLAMILSAKDYAEEGLSPLTAKGQIVGDWSRVSRRRDDGVHVIRSGEELATLASKAEESIGGMERGTLVFVVELQQADGAVRRRAVKRRRDGYMCAARPSLAPLLHRSASVYQDFPRFRDLPALPPYFHDRGEARFVQAMDTAVIAEALQVAAYLVSLYPIDLWTALQFLMTGGCEALDPLKPDFFAYGPQRVMRDRSGDLRSRPFFKAEGPTGLLVQPWVGAEALASYWRTLQRSTAGHPPLVPLKHNLDVFQFVLRNTPPGGAFQWRRLSQAWIEEKGQHISGSAMQLIFQRVREALFPRYTQSPDEVPDRETGG